MLLWFLSSFWPKVLYNLSLEWLFCWFLFWAFWDRIILIVLANERLKIFRLGSWKVMGPLHPQLLLEFTVLSKHSSHRVYKPCSSSQPSCSQERAAISDSSDECHLPQPLIPPLGLANAAPLLGLWEVRFESEYIQGVGMFAGGSCWNSGRAGWMHLIWRSLHPSAFTINTT